jgi:hypothetical protein
LTSQRAAGLKVTGKLEKRMKGMVSIDFVAERMALRCDLLSRKLIRVEVLFVAGAASGIRSKNHLGGVGFPAAIGRFDQSSRRSESCLGGVDSSLGCDG